MLEVYDLQCQREDKKLFSSLAFKLENGSLLLIKGPNGSGKTTLLKILAGIHRPIVGSILWHGYSIYSYPQFFAELVYVGHKFGIKLGLTVYENLKYFVSLNALESSNSKGSFLGKHDFFGQKYSISIQEVIHEVLKKLSLDHLAKEPAEILSRGQLQRLSLARILIHPGKLWLMDEPLAGLDVEGQALIENLVQNHCKKGGMVVISHHEVYEGGKTFFSCSQKVDLMLGSC